MYLINKATELTICIGWDFGSDWIGQEYLGIVVLPLR